MKLIEDPRISARINCLDICEGAFYRITQPDLKWHPNKMHVRKKEKVALLKENQDLLKRVMVGSSGGCIVRPLRAN